MKIISVHALDELGRVTIPKKLMGDIGWIPKDQLSMCINLHEKTVALFQQQDGEFVLDDFNRVKLPGDLLANLEWGGKDKLAITWDTTEKTVTLTMEEKYAPLCIFCKKPEVSKIIHGVGICAEHVEAISAPCTK